MNTEQLLPRASNTQSDKGKQKAMDIFLQNNSNICARLKGDMEHKGQHASNMVLHKRNTVELRSGDIIIMTPRFCQLPNEIISLILNHNPHHERQGTLYECALVNKAFHRMTIPLLWQAPNFDHPLRSAHLLRCLSDASPPQQFAHHLRDLVLEGQAWTDTQLLRLLPHLSLLQRLMIVSQTHITDMGFDQVPYHCQQLTSLSLHATCFTRASFATIGRYCHHLTDLTWALFRSQSLAWLLLLRSCPLEQLDVTSKTAAWNDTPAMLLTSWPRLTSLKIRTRATYPLDTMPIWWPQLTRTTTTAPPLTNLFLSPCHTINDAGLIELTKSYPYLASLHLDYGLHLSDASIDALWLPHLTSVTLMSPGLHVSCGSLRRLLTRCRRLRHVSIKNHTIAPYDDLNGDPATWFKGLLDSSAIDKIRRVELE